MRELVEGYDDITPPIRSSSDAEAADG